MSDYFYTTILAKMRLRLTQNQLCGVTSLGTNFSCASFLSTLEDALKKKKVLCENSGFIAFLKLGEMESWLPFRFLIERLSFIELWITDYIQGRKDLLLS